jgi:hypothetical protein
VPCSSDTGPYESWRALGADLGAEGAPTSDEGPGRVGGQARERSDEAEPSGEREVTLKGVTLATKGRRRGGDVFDVVLAPSGVEIRRPNQPVRHLVWERITEWEIVSRRGGVRLIFRGGGSVTPMVVPGWDVDALDAALRAATEPVEQTQSAEEP